MMSVDEQTLRTILSICDDESRSSQDKLLLIAVVYFTALTKQIIANAKAAAPPQR